MMEKAARRLMHAGLVRGWEAWHSRWLAYRRRVQAMRQAAGRLLRPGVAKALAHWRRDWAAEERRLLDEILLWHLTCRLKQLVLLFPEPSILLLTSVSP